MLEGVFIDCGRMTGREGGEVPTGDAHRNYEEGQEVEKASRDYRTWITV